MSAAFTPGPWSITGEGWVTYGAGLPYVKIISPWVESAWEDDPEALANMRLIASAPELCEAANAAFDFLGGVDGAVEIRGLLLDAINKARGEQQ